MNVLTTRFFIQSNMLFLLQVLLTSVLLLPTFCTTEEFYVSPTPPPNPACPSGKPCNTLDEYARNYKYRFYFSHNIHLLFLDGIHGMSENQQLLIGKNPQLILSSFNNSFSFNEPRVKIRGMNAIFSEISKIKIANISFHSGHTYISEACSVIVHQSLYDQYGLSVNALGSVQVTKSKFNSSSFFFQNYEYPTSENEVIINCSIYWSIVIFEMSDTYFSEMSSTSVNIDFVPKDESVKVKVHNAQVYSRRFIVLVSEANSVLLELINCSFTSTKMTLTNHQGWAPHFVVNILDSSFIRSKAVVSAAVLLLHRVLFVETNVEDRMLILRGPMNATIDSCLFSNNTVSVSTVEMDKVNLFFVGNSTFSNNVGSNGGAIYMSKSIMWLERGAHISFVNNTALQVGGAISFGEKIENCIYNCFYQLTVKEGNISLVFSNNSAAIGGDNIFGAAITDDCIQTNESFSIFHMAFEFQTPSLSSVSSTPKRVCLCDDKGVPQCENIDYIYYNVSVTPGEMFTLSAVLVGDFYGTVTGGVYASSTSETHSNYWVAQGLISPSSIKEIQSTFKFAIGQNLQQINSNKQCSPLNYSVYPVNVLVDEVKFIMSTDIVAAASQRISLSREDFRKTLLDKDYVARFTALLSAPVVVTVRLLPCPKGFEMSSTTTGYVCQCEIQLSMYIYNCVVVNSHGKHFRNRTTWIGSNNGNLSDIILAHSLCPFDYCKAEPVAISLYNPDPQCALNHSGILCGGCPPSLSLAIGSSRCLPCPDNKFVSLFLVFALAGISLILLIKVLDLTVSHGTINGLIFYANAVWIHEGIFFSLKNENTNSDL